MERRRQGSGLKEDWLTVYHQTRQARCVRHTGTSSSRSTSILVTALGSAPVEAVCVGVFCFRFIYHLLWLHQVSNWVFMSLLTWFFSVLALTGGLYVFAACPISDKWNGFSGLEGLYVQMAALRSSHNTTTSRGLNLFSVCVLFSVFLLFFLFSVALSPSLTFSLSLCLTLSPLTMCIDKVQP